MKDYFNQNNYTINSSLPNNPSLYNMHQQLGHQTVIIKNLEQSLKSDKISNNNELIPNYYEWSLCDINNAYNDLFNRIPSRYLQLLSSSKDSQFESLSYFNCKKIGQFSLMYDRIIHGDYIYLQQHFGTSQLNKPHPIRNSISCEEKFRWIPVRSSSIIGRRAHLPLDIFGTTSIITNKNIQYIPF